MLEALVRGVSMRGEKGGRDVKGEGAEWFDEEEDSSASESEVEEDEEEDVTASLRKSVSR
jgi:hypothetical protein